MAEITLTTTGTTLTLTASGESLTFAAGGELNAAANVGGGDAEVFRDKIGTTLNFRTLTGIGDITIVENGDVVEISGGAAGEINLGANVGGGAVNVFRDKTGVTLNFRTVTGTGGIVVSENGDVVEIDGSGVSGGDVVGPAAATDEAIARFDGATGKLIQNSLVTLDDAGAIIGTSPFDIKLAVGGRLSLATTFADLSMGGTARFQVGGSGGVVLQAMFPSNRPAVAYNVGQSGRTEWISEIADTATAVGYQFRTFSLIFDAFSPGALHTEWVDKNFVTILSLEPDGSLFVLGDLEIDGDLNHDGSNVGFYGTAPAAQSAAYTLNATAVLDRTLLASASATTINNNNVLAALITDLQAIGLFG